MAAIKLNEDELIYVMAVEAGIDPGETKVAGRRTEIEESLREKKLLEMNFSGEKKLTSEIKRLLAMFQCDRMAEIIIRKPDEDKVMEAQYFFSDHNIYGAEISEDGEFILSDKDAGSYIEALKIPCPREKEVILENGAVKMATLREVVSNLRNGYTGDFVGKMCGSEMPEKTADTVVGAMTSKNGVYSVLFENKKDGNRTIETITFLIGNAYLMLENSQNIGEDAVLQYIYVDKTKAQEIVDSMPVRVGINICDYRTADSEKGGE